MALFGKSKQTARAVPEDLLAAQRFFGSAVLQKPAAAKSADEDTPGAAIALRILDRAVLVLLPIGIVAVWFLLANRHVVEQF